MNRATFISLIEELLEIEPGTLKGDEQLDSLDWNSIAVIGFLVLADEKFGITVPPAGVARCRTIEDLAALLGDSVSMVAA